MTFLTPLCSICQSPNLRMQPEPKSLTALCTLTATETRFYLHGKPQVRNLCEELHSRSSTTMFLSASVHLLGAIWGAASTYVHSHTQYFQSRPKLLLLFSLSLPRCFSSNTIFSVFQPPWALFCASLFQPCLLLSGLQSIPADPAQVTRFHQAIGNTHPLSGRSTYLQPKGKKKPKTNSVLQVIREELNCSERFQKYPGN